jgi:serine/threonine protein kinase
MTSVSSEETIFNAARRISSPADRRLYLEQSCRGDAALQNRVEALLRVHEQAHGFLQVPPPAAWFPADGLTERGLAQGAELPGMQIGPYKLREQIGEGGFGVVFTAEQHEPIRRKVALKVLKAGMDSKTVIARFEAERQALALMDHPNIAGVLDAGQTAAGRPYFVMDLVEGPPITNYCDGAQLPAKERLELFVQVCHAVQHAHQKGVIHRDIKPSNVLVTLQDGVPLAKVIDFGIAKALGQQLTTGTVFTGFAQMVGTPLYMSPEQAALRNVDVDTRTDIYSLGVLLYELLTGTTPFGKERFDQAGYDELRRILCEDEPPRPSTRVSTMGQFALQVSAYRRSDPRRLGQLLRGELDWIVLKALEKDRDRRYDTAGALAEDVHRYLHGNVVSACPPSVRYRFRKLARRHKTGVIAATVVSLALVAGTAISLWQAIRATQAMSAERRALLELGAEQSATRRGLARAQAAESKAARELFESLVAQARANRRSRRIGQRFQTLDILKKATAIARELDLGPKRFLEIRNEAIAALALADMRVAKEWPGVADAAACFDSALARYALIDGQGQVSVRRTRDGQEICRVAHRGPGTYWSGWSPDGVYLALSDWSRGRLDVWRLAGATPADVLDEPADRCFAFSPESRRIALTQADGTVALFDPATGKGVGHLPTWTPGPDINHIAFHPKGDRLALACRSTTLVRDVQTGKVLWRKDPRPGTGASRVLPFVAWHPGGDILALGDGDAISLWDVSKDQHVGKLDGYQGGISFTFSQDGAMLATSGWSGLVRFWDAMTSRQLLHTHMASTRPEFSVDGRWLAANQLEQSLRILEIADTRGYRTLVAGAVTGRLDYQFPAISPDGKLLTAGTYRGVAIWDLVRGKELAFVETSGVTLAAFENRPPVAAGQGTTTYTLLSQGSTGGLLRRTIRFNPAGGAIDRASRKVAGSARRVRARPEPGWSHPGGSAIRRCYRPRSRPRQGPDQARTAF